MPVSIRYIQIYTQCKMFDHDFILTYFKTPVNICVGTAVCYYVTEMASLHQSYRYSSGEIEYL